MIYLYGVTYGYWLWPIQPLYGLEPTHPKAFFEPSTTAAALVQDFSSREGEKQLQGALWLFAAPFTHPFLFPKQFWFIDHQASCKGNSFFPGHWGNEDAPVGHTVDTLKYVICCWLSADILIHSWKGRPPMILIRNMNSEIIKEHVR